MSVSMLPTTHLELDGERCAPGAGVEIAYHRWLRHRLALRLAADKRVLDVGSGEGHGAALMGQVAREVTGVEGDERAVRRARKAHVDRTNVVFQCAEIEQFLAAAEPHRYDLVTAFEVIERVDEQAQRRLVHRFRHVLAPGGLALISTPDKRLHSDARRSRDPLHVRELYRREFDALLREVFPHVCILEQVACTGAAVFGSGTRQAELMRAVWKDLPHLDGSCEPGLEGEGEYLLALVSDEPIPEEATAALALLDPARELIGEELQAAGQLLDAERRAAAGMKEELVRARAEAAERIGALEREVGALRAQRESAEARASEAEALRRRIEAMEDVVERFALAAARAQDEITRVQRLESELGLVRRQLEADRHALVHLRQMLGVRLVLKAKAALDGMPRLRRAVKAVTRRLG